MTRLLLALPLMLGLCAGDETVSGYVQEGSVFVLEELDGTPFPARATIAFPEEGVARGEAPCNSYSARLTVPIPWFELREIAATRRACPDPEAEADYFNALREMTLAEISHPVLLLSNDDGREMVFRAANE